MAGAIFFDEGPGHLFIKILGEGADNSACLVRNINNGALYVRKESLEYSKERRPVEAHATPREALNGLIIQDIKGVYQLCGWTNWIDCTPDEDGFYRVLHVTYWKFCNVGTMRSFRREFEISESLMCYWLKTMIQTLVDIHTIGMTHNDTHSSNWLLHQNDDEPVPHVVLADFGRAQRRAELAAEEWLECCTDDFRFLMNDLGQQLRLQRGHFGRIRRLDHQRCSEQLLKILKRFAKALEREPETVSKLHEKAQKLLQELETRIEETGPPTPASHSCSEADEYGDLGSVDWGILGPRSRIKQYQVALINLPQGDSPGSITHPGGNNGNLCRNMIVMADGDYAPRRENTRYRVWIATEETTLPIS